MELIRSGKGSIFKILENVSAGRTKRGGGPHVARGPPVAHPYHRLICREWAVYLPKSLGKGGVRQEWTFGVEKHRGLSFSVRC